MVRRRSKNAVEIDSLVTKAVLGVQSGLYKSSYEAAKVLEISKDTVTRRVKGGLTRSQAREKQQKLSAVQEKVLLKWIKELLISGYSLGHWLLKELAKEIRTKQTYNLDDPSLDTLQLPPQYKLSKDWVPRFIKRHPHLKVVIRRRIDFIWMDGTLKLVLEAWFNAY